MTTYIVDLESVPTRYTCEWKEHLPTLFKDAVNISGGSHEVIATPGAFLNFQATNIYKNDQMNQIANMFGLVKPGDKFVFADAWNTGILQLKYMSELLNKPIEIHALWHAGSYDPQDFLGRLIKDKRWTYSTERALYYAIDYNWFATEFHKKMFTETLEVVPDRMYITGWPMEYMPTILSPYKNTPKKNKIVFPHRLAPEKQLDIFQDLAAGMPTYEWHICQLNTPAGDAVSVKREYHQQLAESKVLFSANLQETLGISPYEGAILGVFPYLPNRLSYTEMYPSAFLYDSKWTESFESYKQNRHNVIAGIHNIIRFYDVWKPQLPPLVEHLSKNYFSATNLQEKINGSK